MANIKQIKIDDGTAFDIECDYSNVTTKPTLNNVTLTGDMTSEDIIPLGMGLIYDSNGAIAVSYNETENPSGGTTVNIGGSSL